jgi:threonine dehydratase
LAAFPCEIHQAGADYDSTHAVADAYARDRGATYLSAYDDPIVVAGQGTVGLEITEDEPDVDVLLVPVGGGGLIAGMAVVAKALKPNVQIIGVQPEASPSAFLSLRDGHPHETFPAAPTICDGLAGGFGKVPFQIAADLIDKILIIPEADVRHAVGWLLMHEQMIVEGSGAIAVAPLLNGRLDLAGGRAVAVLTGRNLDSKLMRSILEEQMMEETG